MDVRAIAVKVLVLPLCFILVSCSSGSEDRKTRDVAPDYSEYSKASCVFGYNEGNLVANSNSRQIVTSYFGKRYDLGLLIPVLAASGAELVSYAESKTNVRYYKTSSYHDDSCGYSVSLPSAPSDLEADFSKVAGKDDKAGILGLYHEEKTPYLPSTSKNATIVVRSDSNKWVLIHEYMHHLFWTQLKTDDTEAGPDLQKRFLKNYEDYEDLMKRLDRLSDDEIKSVSEAKNKLQKVGEDGIRILKSYFLEEMTIETILGDFMSNGELRFVHPPQRINGAFYVLMSAKTAEKIIRELDDKVYEFRIKYGRKLGSEDYSKLTSISTQFSSLKSDIDALKSKARNFLSEKDLEFRGLVSVPAGSAEKTPEHPAGCAHGQLDPELQQFIDKLGA